MAEGFPDEVPPFAEVLLLEQAASTDVAAVAAARPAAPEMN